MKFPIIKSCLARFSGIFAVGTPSNIHGTAISYRCAKFGAFVNSVTILTLRDLTTRSTLIDRIHNTMFLLLIKFPDIVEFSEEMASLGKIVIVAALDGTFQRQVVIILLD